MTLGVDPGNCDSKLGNTFMAILLIIGGVAFVAICAIWAITPQ